METKRQNTFLKKVMHYFLKLSLQKNRNNLFETKKNVQK
jgi:hypothetical protein